MPSLAHKSFAIFKVVLNVPVKDKMTIAIIVIIILVVILSVKC